MLEAKPEPGFAIRPLASGDQAEWDRLCTAYLALYETSLPKQVRNTALERLLSSDQQEFQGPVAEQDGTQCSITAVASISTRASSSTSPATTTIAMAGKLRPMTLR